MANPHITSQVRASIIALHNAGHPVKEIKHLLNLMHIALSTLYRTIARSKNPQAGLKSDYRGRPRKFTHRQRLRLLKIILKNNFKDKKQIRDLNNSYVHQPTASMSTIRRELNSFNLNQRISRRGV